MYKYRTKYTRLTNFMRRILLEKPPVAQLTQQPPNILWNPNFHYRVHTGPYLEPVEFSSYHTILFL
jgi:hypothetical protein